MLYSNPNSGPFDGDAGYDQRSQQPIRVEAGMYIYELRVVQQPIRARMCGFGEKDRRPCTPPPILQLIIYDRSTRQLVDIEHVNTSFFTATCSLYSADMGVEMDLIRQRAANDSGHGSTMGASTIHMPMQTTDGTAIDNPQQGDIGSTEISNNQLPRIPEDGSVAIRSAHTTVSNDFGTMDGLSSPRTAGDSAIMSLGQNVASSSSIMSFSAGSRPDAVPQEVDDSDTSLCIVRNLIGSSVTAGSKLVSMDGSLGIFFVFPDLSIRKDGDYRLRFSFFNLQSDNGELMSTVTQIKAHTFSEPFRVYSAKQFPGMIESTMMSKHFAKQGVKIPVRKESGRAGDFDS